MAINIYKHVDVASAGGGDGSTWALAGANAAYTEAELEVFLEAAVVAGDVIFVKDGVYTLDSDINSGARNGTVVSPIAIIGVKAGTTNVGANIVYADWSIDAADKPFFDCATFGIEVGAYYELRNLDMQGADNWVLLTGINCLVENCKLDNDAAAAVKYALNSGAVTRIYNCELLSANCNALALSGGGRVKYNYIHDCVNAVQGHGIVVIAGNYVVIEFNILDNNRMHISGSSTDYTTVDNNTFYGGTTGISETTGDGWTIVNNIFSDLAGAPMSWTTQTDANFIWSNHIFNCGANVNIDETTVFQDYEVTTGDPLFTTAGSDFSLATGSPCIDAGQSIELGVG